MRTFRRIRPALAFLLLACSPAVLLFAQAPQPKSTTKAASAASAAPSVTLAVTVRDKQGNMIPGLTAADFTLQQDGKTQTIQSVVPASTEPLDFGLVAQISGGARRLLDDERTAGKNFAGRMMTKPGDRAFVVQFGHEVDLLSDLSPQVKTFAGGLKQLGLPQSQNAPADTDTSGGHHLQGGHNTLYDAIYLASSEVLNKPARRKVLIVFTDGVDRGSKESLFSAIEAAQRNNVTVYAIYFKDEQAKHSRFNMPDHRRGTGMGYPGRFPGGGGYPSGYPGGYPGGGNPTPQGRPTQGSRVNGRGILEQICSETGGYMFELNRRLSVAHAFDAIALELNARYLIGYTPDGKDNYPGYHNIKLTTQKKELIVQTRQGYYSGGA